MPEVGNFFMRQHKFYENSNPQNNRLAHPAMKAKPPNGARAEYFLSSRYAAV